MAENRITLRIIEEPDRGSRNVLMLRKGPLPALRGPGNLTYMCGNPECGVVLVEGVFLSDVVIGCPECGLFNEGPSLAP